MFFDEDEAFSIIDELHSLNINDFLNDQFMVKYYLENKLFGINDYLENGETLLIYATSMCDEDYVKMLLEFNPDVEIKSKRYGTSALLRSCHESNINIVKLLLTHNANINTINIYGITPLMSACSSNNISVVELLLDNGADIEFKDNEGNTALMYATELSSYNIVKLLLAHDANINTTNDSGLNPLISSVIHFNPGSVKALVEYGVDEKIKREALKLSKKYEYDIITNMLR